MTKSLSAKSGSATFKKYINDDLNTPKALALMWKLIRNNKASYKLLLEFDKIFGLDLDKIKETKIPEKVKKLAKQREKYRKENEWKKSDEIRKGIEKLGYQIEDTPQGPKLK